MEARQRIHWAVQIPAAVASSLVHAADDDSHSNLGWDPSRGALVSRRLELLSGLGGGARVGVHPSTLSVLVMRGDGSIVFRRSLEGETLESGLSLVREELGRMLGVDVVPDSPFRTYELPSHPVGDGARFEVADVREELRSVSDWFDLSADVLSDFAARWLRDPRIRSIQVPRIWPHHFDLGGLIDLRDEAEFEQIGFGFEPGDESVSAPYLYVNPYPQPKDPIDGDPPGRGRWQSGPPVGAIWSSEPMADEDARDAAPDHAVRELFPTLRQRGTLVRHALELFLDEALAHLLSPRHGSQVCER